MADIRLGGPEPASNAGRSLNPDSVDGIQAVRRLVGRGSATQVIYLTGYTEYCTEVYETDHIYFLTKPICQADFNRALGRALENLRLTSPRSISVRTGRNSLAALPVGDISFIESRLRKLEIHVGGETYETYGTIPELLERLPDSFIQVHKSFAVNLDCVCRFEADELVLSTGDLIPVSRRRKKDALEALFSRLGR